MAFPREIGRIINGVEGLEPGTQPWELRIPPANKKLDIHDKDKWQEAAACKGEPSSVFYPETEAEAGPARAICARCPVSDLCLAVALRNGERHGVWGGKSERERARLRRSLNAAS